jgi:hypothetical protein
VPATADKQYVVTAGSIGGEHKTGAIIPADAYPQERMAHFLARGAIKVATEEDIQRHEAEVRGIAALGSTDAGTMTPMAIFEQEKASRDAEIQGLEARIRELEERNDRELPRLQENAELQEAAMEELGTLPLAGGHSGAASTAENTAESGKTEGGGEPSEPVDPARQSAREAQTAEKDAEANKPSADKPGVSVRGRSSS